MSEWIQKMLRVGINGGEESAQLANPGLPGK